MHCHWLNRETTFKTQAIFLFVLFLLFFVAVGGKYAILKSCLQFIQNKVTVCAFIAK